MNYLKPLTNEQLRDMGVLGTCACGNPGYRRPHPRKPNTTYFACGPCCSRLWLEVHKEQRESTESGCTP